MTTARLAFTDLGIGYDIVLARSMELTVSAGEIVAITGPSGCGKSTLLQALVGAITPLSGSIRVDGVDVTRAPIHERGIGIMFQEPLLFPHLDVAANVGYGLRWGGPVDADRVQELLALVELTDFAHRSVDTLSGGQAQRVALARALAPRPKVLLLDEPLSALDPELRERLAGDVARILRATGTAALYVTHDHTEAAAIADRIVAFHELAA